MEQPETLSRNKPRLLIATHFLPVTLNFENAPLQSQATSPLRAQINKSESLTATGPPSRYHFRSDSNAERMPFNPKSPPKSFRPLIRSNSGGANPLLNWKVVPSFSGNVGLSNAIGAMKNDFKLQPLYVGQLSIDTDILSDFYKQEVRETLVRDHKSLPVFVGDDESQGHYVQFCKGILWPTFHYILPDYLKTSMTEKTAWNHYVAVNQRFADVLAQTYCDGDVVWINDYHLMLVPAMLRELRPCAKIGFFLHIPFPSDEVFRCLYVRRELLNGLLAADLIGYQTYSFARHFLMTCSKILGLESTPKGVILSDGRLLPVQIFPIGIDIDAVNRRLQMDEVNQTISMLREKYQGKRVIVARDKLDPVKGVRQKLLSFELFLNKFPQWQGKVVLVQVAQLTTDHPELQKQVSELASRINSKFGTIEYAPISYLHQDISHSHYLALFSIADACLITSLRDGMNLTSHEFIACQKGNYGPLIISEFTGTYGSFSSALRVNPWDYNEVASSINDALSMAQEDRVRAYKELYNNVVSNTGGRWAENFIAELMRSSSRAA